MEELRMKDLYIGKRVTVKQIRKFSNFVIVLGNIEETTDSADRLEIYGDILFVGKSINDFDYKGEKDDRIYIKSKISGSVYMVEEDPEEEMEYEQVFGSRNG